MPFRKELEPISRLESQLAQIDRRSNWMWTLGVILLVLQGAAIVLLYLPQFELGNTSIAAPESRGVLATSLVGLTLLFALYTTDRHLGLRRIRRAVEEERAYLASMRLRLNELSELFEVATRMGTYVDERSYLETVSERLQVALDAHCVMIFRWSAERSKLRCEVSAGKSPPYAEGALATASEDVPLLVSTVREARVWDRIEIDRQSPKLSAHDADVVSLVCVPLAERDRREGAILALRRSPGRLFLEEDGYLLGRFSDFLGEDLRKVRRLETLVQRNEDLEGANRRLHHLADLKSVFLATVRNEIRSPLAAIAYHAELLSGEDSTDSRPSRESSLEALTGEVSFLGDYVNEIAELLSLESQPDRTHRDDVPLHELLEDTLLGITAKAARKDVAIFNEVGKDAGTVRTDRARVSKVLRYLLAQEVRAVSEGGTVRIEPLPQLGSKWRHETRIRIVGEPRKDMEGTVQAGLGHHLAQEILQKQNGDLRFGAASGITLTLPTAVRRDVAPETIPSEMRSAA